MRGLWLLLFLPGLVLADEPPLWSEQTGMAISAETMQAYARQHLDREPPDLDQAVLWFHGAAEAGSSEAMVYLGWFHEQGFGVEQNGALAVDWYARAVEAGALDHTLHLGWTYLRGEIVPRDRALAENWFRRGIAAAHHPARVALASVLIADVYGGRDPDMALEAETLLREALEGGIMLASYFLAKLYIEGLGAVERDPDQALYYTRIGAEDGNPQMQGWLAVMYSRGDGVEVDPIEANKWASLAAAGGDELGNRLRVELEADMAPEAVTESRRRAVEWASVPGR